MSKSYLKLALASLVLLSGCAVLGPSPAFTTSNQPLVAVGHGQDIEWKCSQTENDATTAVVDCKFHKFTTTGAKTQSCIQLTYSPPNSIEQVSSRTVCSDLLEDDEYTNHIVAFQNQLHRELILFCGNNQCRLNAREVSTPTGK